MVNVEDASCSLMTRITNKEWGDIPYPGLMFYQTSSQEVMTINPITDKDQEVLSHNKRNDNIILVKDIILAAIAEPSIDENWGLLDNKTTCNAFIIRKYLSNIRYSPDGQYLHVHCNTGVKNINNIGDLPGY